MSWINLRLSSEEQLALEHILEDTLSVYGECDREGFDTDEEYAEHKEVTQLGEAILSRLKEQS